MRCPKCDAEAVKLPRSVDVPDGSQRIVRRCSNNSCGTNFVKFRDDILIITFTHSKGDRIVYDFRPYGSRKNEI